MIGSGEKMFEFCENLFPINRSLTGDGVRETLSIIKEELSDLNIYEVPSGTKCFDWTVPDEWNIRKAYVIDPDGKKIIDFLDNNLHVVGYSVPIDEEMSLEKLDKHLHSLPNQPNAIPYVTSYYKKNWGFCLKHEQRKELKEGTYRVHIDSSLDQGSLTYGELIVNKGCEKEIFLSTYICHPSMANDETSGMVVAIFLANYLRKKKTRYSYRFLFNPETIGSISYLSKNIEKLKKNMLAGYVLSCVGDDRCFSFLPSKYGNTPSDSVAKFIFDKIKSKKKIYDWNERGSDERQYCAPFVDLPVSSIMRSKYMEYSEYHTSLDKIGTVVTNKGLMESIKFYINIIEKFENSFFPIANKICEPFMTKYNLYSTLKNKKNRSLNVISNSKIMNFLTWCDGKNSLDDISNLINLNKNSTSALFKLLLKKKLIKII